VPAEVNNPAPFGLVRFSPDQKLLAAGVEGRVHVVDAFSGDFRFSLATGVPPGGSAPEFAFTPDSRYLLSGAAPPAPRASRSGARPPCLKAPPGHGQAALGGRGGQRAAAPATTQLHGRRSVW
jgi:hypothetical protein